MALWTRLILASACFVLVLTVLPPWRYASNFWWYNGIDYINRVKRCAASLQNKFTKNHVTVVVLITMEYGLSSALSIESENALYKESIKVSQDSNRTLWGDDGFIIFHNIHDAWWPNWERGDYSPVDNVIYYPKRSTNNTVDNPSLVKDDLALVRYNSSKHTKFDICRCVPTFLMEPLPDEYEVFMSGFTGARPSEATKIFSTYGKGIVVKCSIGDSFGNFFCLKKFELYPFGLDSGGAVYDYNGTLLGIGSFSLKMQGEIMMSYITNLSHVPYRRWIQETAMGANVTSISYLAKLSRPDQSNDHNNSCHQYDFFQYWWGNEYPHGIPQTRGRGLFTD